MVLTNLANTVSFSENTLYRQLAPSPFFPPLPMSLRLPAAHSFEWGLIMQVGARQSKSKQGKAKPLSVHFFSPTVVNDPITPPPLSYACNIGPGALVRGGL